MYVFRLGIIAFLLSDCLISGLTTGAAFHIFSAQAKDFVGISIPSVGAYFQIIKVRAVSGALKNIFTYQTDMKISCCLHFLAIHRDISTLRTVQLCDARNLSHVDCCIAFQQ